MNNIFYSTRSDMNPVSSYEAILKGIAEDGGLLMFKKIDKINIDNFINLEFKDLSKLILSKFLIGYTGDEIDNCVKNAYNIEKFDTNEITPLKQVGDKFVLELFHGRTSAFKDIALSVLPYLMTTAMKKLERKDEIFILTATSGDTGSSALTGFSNINGIKILVFYPSNGISDIQKLQMTTNSGNNVYVCAINGNFDNAQSGVKEIFKNISSEFCTENNVSLSSANSINIGRLVPQIVYYFYAYNSLVKMKKIKKGDLINFSVPTGNFGDILAGYLAKCAGLPIKKLFCASNSNNVLTDFFKTSIYNIDRTFNITLSPSMDILISSNLERLLYLISHNDYNFVKECMISLKEKKQYSLPKKYAIELQETFEASFVTDEETKKTIKRVFEEEKYLLDPHTAVAWRTSENFSYKEPCVVLSTASPYKFPLTILNSLNQNVSDNMYVQLKEIEKITNTNIPINLKNAIEKEERFKDIIHPNDMMNYVKEKIKNG